MSAFDVAIVGAGPGGYVAAIRGAQLGLRVALVEREAVGGLCLNWGCIPTKALLRSAEVLALTRRAAEFGVRCGKPEFDLAAAVDRSRQIVDRLTRGIQALLKKNRVEVLKGEGRLLSADRVEVHPSGQVVETKNVILATGARPRGLPFLPVDGEGVITSRHALELREAPESILIIGAGPIGVEFASLYNTIGSKVTVIEMLPHVLPLEDSDISAELERSLTKQGITLMTGATVASASISAEGVILHVSGAEGAVELTGDKVLVAIGVQGNSEGLEAAGVKAENSFVPADERMRTNVPGVYAIGDVTGKMPLAHTASAQGEIAVEDIAGHNPEPLNYETIPRGVYCQPQVASFGLTEAEAKERVGEVKVGKFPFRASGKALAMGETEGFVKIVSEATTGEVLGAHLIGPEVTELLPELSLAQALEATPTEIAATVHAHPTLAEVLREVALATEGRAIHI